jgi:oligosaccharide repeat unit polymerase
MMHVVVNSYYVTHEVPMLDRTLNATARVGPYYGAYEFYLVAAFVERVAPGLNIDAVMVPELKAADVYGWFSTAWGGMYLDFGLVGALICAALCGWFAGATYRRALSGSDDGARLLMCYAFAGILASPILSIFTISISLPILASLLLTSWMLRFSWPVRVRVAVARSP